MRTSGRFTTVASPVGELLVIADADGAAITHLRFPGATPPAGARRQDDGLLGEAARQLRAYAAGRRASFDLPLRFVVGGPFERRVWAAVAAVPYGTTTTYGTIAAALGAPAAARAVGAANGRNPLPVVVPCHRVLGAGGRLTGYGGGLDRKRILLEHEGVLVPTT